MGIILNKPKRAERASKVSRQNITSTIKDVQIRSVYKLGKIIGTGHFGVVREATATGSNEKVAIKSILKSLLNDKLNYLMQEIEILKKVDHPNIIRFYEAYEDDRYIYIVMEFCNGGDLFRKMTTLEHLDENETRSLIRQILLSVNHLHQNNIVHRDLKPENFLFETKDQATILKLVDFGLSSRFKNKSRSFHSTVGTIYYLAPEVIHGNYNYKCDL